MASDEQIRDFLKRMAMIESSNRYNVQHQPVNSKMHQGDSAVGKYGLMPLTIDSVYRDIKNTNPNADASDPTQHLPLPLLPNIPENGVLSHLNAQHLAGQVQMDPASQEVLARHLATTILNKPNIDDERAAYMWQYGQNQKPWKMTSDLMNSNDRVQKYRKLVQKDNPGVPQMIEASRSILPKGLVDQHFEAAEAPDTEEVAVTPKNNKAKEGALKALRGDDDDES